MGLNRYYKESEYVEDLLRKRKWDTSVKGNLKVVARYLKSKSPTLTETELENELILICEKKCEDWFNKVKDYKMIDSAVKVAFADSTMIDIGNIPITRAEIDYIKSLPFENLNKKIVFCLLVINKLNNARMKIKGIDKKNNYFGGSGEYSYKTLLDTMSEKLTRTYREKGIHEAVKLFNDNGLTRTTNRLSLELLFLEQIEECDEIVLNVDDFDDIGLFWDYINNSDKIKICELCNSKIIKINSNKTRYCNRCFAEHRKKYIREKVKEFRCKQIEE